MENSFPSSPSLISADLSIHSHSSPRWQTVFQNPIHVLRLLPLCIRKLIRLIHMCILLHKEIFNIHCFFLPHPSFHPVYKYICMYTYVLYVVSFFTILFTFKHKNFNGLSKSAGSYMHGIICKVGLLKMCVNSGK